MEAEILVIFRLLKYRNGGGGIYLTSLTPAWSFKIEAAMSFCSEKEAKQAIKKLKLKGCEIYER